MPARPQPQPGAPIRRGSKPYIWATWIAKLLGGDQCLYSAWFRAHFQHAKFEEEASQLAEWNRDHTALMRQVRADLEENGWQCRVESENDFKLEGTLATVAGKPDLVATMPGHMLVVDGKTGKRRDSDVWQVLIYLYAIQLQHPDLTVSLAGEVFYKGASISVRASELNEARREDIVRMVKVVAAATPPAKAPSRSECKRCNIGPLDCPDRVMHEREPVMAAEF